MEYKTCKNCNESLPKTKEYFHRRKTAKDGFTYECKECRNKKSAEWRVENREYAKEYARNNYKENSEILKEKNRIYRKYHKEQIREYRKEYYQKNKEDISEYSKLYRENNRERLAKYDGEYYLQNRERKAETHKQWIEDNREHRNDYLRILSQERRAKLKQLPYSLSLDEWIVLKGDFNNSCAYCGIGEGQHVKKTGENLAQEHFIPLSKGGEYTHNNIIPACKSCNSSKHNKDFFEWYSSHESYSKQREQFILKHLGYEDDTQQLALFK